MRWCALLVLLCSACVEDHGLMVRDGAELHRETLPALVVVEESEDLDEATVSAACEWWGEQLGQTAFELGIPADVHVAVGYVPCDDIDDLEGCPSGLADVGYDSDGVIVDCVVTVSSDVAYHGPTVDLVLRHELGHCLGLDDDPASLDLGSIMSDPTVGGSGLTDHDRRLIMEALR